MPTFAQLNNKVTESKSRDEMTNKEWLEDLKIKMDKEEKLAVDELKRIKSIYDDINKESMFGFKVKLNDRKNKFLTVVDGNGWFKWKIKASASIYKDSVTTTLDLEVVKGKYEDNESYDSQRDIKTTEEKN